MASDDARQGGGSTAPSGVHPDVDPRAATALADSGALATVDPMIGTEIDRRYRILQKLGEGGMGEVYLAEHVGLKKKRALKLLRKEIVSNEEAVERFFLEAQAASSIGHRNIVQIVDIARLADGRVYMCMEYLVGQPFNEMIREPIDPPRALNIIIQCCHGLGAAHRQNIVHRDMKPENIFVTREGGVEIPKLLDFGIARVTGNEGQNHLTRTGTIFGTPFYMAPEQALGERVDYRADIYSIGVILYEVFCGAVPFNADSFMAILTKHITTEPVPPLQMAAQNGRVLPPQVEPIIVTCMRKKREERFQTMDSLIGALIEAHRALAGPGMSAYFDAQAAMAGSHGSMQTPLPSPNHPAVTPHGYATGGLGYGTGAPGYTPGAPGASPYPQPDPRGASAAEAWRHDEALTPATSRGPLIAVLLVLFLIGGGVAGYVMWDRQQARATAASASEDRAKSPPGAERAPDAARGGSPTAPGGDTAARAADDRAPPLTPPVDQGAAGEQAGGDGPPAGAVAGDGATGEDDGTGGEAAVATSVVLVNTRPAGARVVANGEVVGRSPVNVEVPVGGSVEIKLERAGYRTETLTIDGSKKKVTESLRKARAGDPTAGSDDGDATTGGAAKSGDDGKAGPRPRDPPKDDRIEPGLIDDDSDILE